MANVVVHSDEHREGVRYAAEKFGINLNSSEGRDQAEVIYARSAEALERGESEGRRYSVCV